MSERPGATLLRAPWPYLGHVVAPYRDELESLRRENERLRAELSREHGWHPRLAVIFIALDVVVVVALRPWLNGANDAHFWTAFFSAGVLGFAAVAAAMGWRRSSR
jgi:hypothetical protein